MKIASLARILPMNNSEAIRVRKINQFMSSLGHEVHLIQFGKRTNYWKNAGHILNLAGVRNSIITAGALDRPIKIIAGLFPAQYDLYFGNGHIATFYISPLIRRHKPIFFDMHGCLIEEFHFEARSHSPSWRVNTFFTNLTNRIIDSVDRNVASKIICVSRRMRRYLMDEKRVPRNKLVYFTNMVDLDSFKPDAGRLPARALRKELNLCGKFIVGYIGFTQLLQGLENLIETARLLNNPNIVFLIVGGEKLHTGENYILLPRVNHHEIQPYYSLCDILILPRPMHPATDIAAPTKFAEYTAMGKPVLVTDVGDPADHVRKYDCGYVAKNNDPVELIKGINDLHEHRTIELENMGRRSRIMAENEFNAKKAGDELKKAIAGLSSI